MLELVSVFSLTLYLDVIAYLCTTLIFSFSLDFYLMFSLMLSLKFSLELYLVISFCNISPPAFEFFIIPKRNSNCFLVSPVTSSALWNTRCSPYLLMWRLLVRATNISLPSLNTPCKTLLLRRKYLNPFLHPKRFTYTFIEFCLVYFRYRCFVTRIN